MKIRMGFIGVGGIGGSHLRIARTLPDLIEPVAVCDVNSDVVGKIGKEYNLDAHTDYKELCHRGDIDAVAMALPHYLYGEAVCCALEAGLHVFKEKPFTSSLADADQILTAANKSGKLVVLAGQNKFTPGFIKGKELIDSQLLGGIFLTRGAIIYRWGGAITNNWSWRGKQKLSGGVAVIDAGWHILDMIHWYRGKPSAVYASLGTMKGVPDSDYDVDDKVALVLEYPDGGIASVVSCYITLPAETRLTLHGVNGSLSASGSSIDLIISGEAQAVALPEQKLDSMTAQMVHFVDTIASGRDSSIAGLQRAYEVMQVVDAAYRSAEAGARVELA